MASKKTYKIFEKATDKEVSLQLYRGKKKTWLVFPSEALKGLTPEQRELYYVGEFEMVLRKKFDVNKQEIK